MRKRIPTLHYGMTNKGSSAGYCGPGTEDLRGLHHQGEFFELFLHALEGAADGLNAGRCTAGGVVGDAIAAHVEEGADEFGCLPGVQTGLQQFLTQRGEIGLGKSFHHRAGYDRFVFHGHPPFRLNPPCPTVRLAVLTIPTQ